MKAFLKLLKFIIIIALLGAVVFVTLQILAINSIIELDEGCASSRITYFKDRTQLTDDYGVDGSKLITVKKITGIYSLTDIPADDIVVDYFALFSEPEHKLFLSNSSQIKEPVLDMAAKKLKIKGEESDIAFAEVIKTALRKEESIPINGGTKAFFTVELNSDGSFYFTGELLRSEGAEGEARKYYVKECGGVNYHLIDDASGFYKWLDENVFA